MRRRILLSNDDGYRSPGLQKLREALEPHYEVYVSAPADERSGTSHAITLGKPIRVDAVDARTFAVHGTPVDSVLLGIFELMPHPPDLVVSGINMGYNIGEDVIYSGTVAAAREGALYGYPALAISIGPYSDFYHFDTAVHFACRVIQEMLSGNLSAPLLNLNVPNRPLSQMRGLRLTRLGRVNYADPVEKVGPSLYRIGGTPLLAREAGTDVEAVEEGYASLTPLLVDFTDHHALTRLAQV